MSRDIEFPTKLHVCLALRGPAKTQINLYILTVLSVFASALYG